MDTVSIDELQALTFFAVDPILRDPDDPWPYNDALYEVTRGNLSLSFSLAPAYRDVRIILKAGGKTIYELNAMDVEDVKYEETKDKEIIEIVLSKRESIFIRVNPSITVEQSLKGEI